MAETRRRFLGTLSAGIGAAAAAQSLLTPARRVAAAVPSGRKLGFAVVGLGRLSGGQLAPALQKTQHCRLTGLVSGSPEKARQWRPRGITGGGIGGVRNRSTTSRPAVEWLWHGIR